MTHLNSLNRRTFLKTAAAFVALGAAPEVRANGNERPEVESQTFAVPGLLPEHDGLRIVQLSDLHCGTPTPSERILEAISLANRLAPDLVLLTGDYVCRERGDVALMESLLGGLAAPTVAVLGNHDHWVDADGATDALERHGYAVLRNQNTTLTLRGSPFTVIGIDDLLTGHASPAEALAGAPQGSRIVLAHGPKTADQLKKMGTPLLCLSGHTHGGQVNLPVLTGFLFYGLARERYARGNYRVGPVQLYVNRGIGNSALRVRLNSAPEVTVATLRPAVG
jgi:predicted MPP superfamily phosphohydrolase